MSEWKPEVGDIVIITCQCPDCQRVGRTGHTAEVLSLTGNSVVSLRTGMERDLLPLVFDLKDIKPVRHRCRNT